MFHTAAEWKIVNGVLLVDKRVQPEKLAEGAQHVHRSSPGIPILGGVPFRPDKKIDRHRSPGVVEDVAEGVVPGGREREEVWARGVVGGPAETPAIACQRGVAQANTVRHHRQLRGHRDQHFAGRLVAAVLLDRPPGVGKPRFRQGRNDRPPALGREHDRGETGRDGIPLVVDHEFELPSLVTGRCQLDLDGRLIQPRPVRVAAIQLDVLDRQRRVKPESKGRHPIFNALHRHGGAAIDELSRRVYFEFQPVVLDIGLKCERIVGALELQISGGLRAFRRRGLGSRTQLRRIDLD